MNNKIHSLALLVNLGIYGVQPCQQWQKIKPIASLSLMKTPSSLPPPSRTCRHRAYQPLPADEIRKNPPARDVSEIIRTMHGVNLTGNSTSGQRGNKPSDRYSRHGARKTP